MIALVRDVVLERVSFPLYQMPTTGLRAGRLRFWAARLRPEADRWPVRPAGRSRTAPKSRGGAPDTLDPSKTQTAPVQPP